MNVIENTINYLKEQLELAGNLWKKDTASNEKMQDCTALLEAINVLEERAYGERITSITYIMG